MRGLRALQRRQLTAQIHMDDSPFLRIGWRPWQDWSFCSSHSSAWCRTLGSGSEQATPGSTAAGVVLVVGLALALLLFGVLFAGWLS